MAPRPVLLPHGLVLSLVLLLCFSPDCAARRVSVSVYYETLCPFCSGFVVNDLARIFQNGLSSIVDLRLVPFGNGRVSPDGSMTCQHGQDECRLNAIEACVIRLWPQAEQHFPFIHCIEHLALTQKWGAWQSCFHESGLVSQPVIDCYNSGYGRKLELQYAAETHALQPPHQFVPWVVVNGRPLADDYTNFEAYVCNTYDGELPEACRGKHLAIAQRTRANKGDKIWYNNVPHPKLVEYKKDQNWVRKSGNYFVFPGGGTQFKAGVTRYIRFIEQIMPQINWGTHTRTVLDVGCGVASFGGYLLDRNVITMSFAPKDEHEAQIQFALERGIPALLAAIGTQKLPFPDNAFDVIHCARCRVHWYADGGKPLLELNRVLRPGGYYIWSATPVYRRGKRDEEDWNAMVTLTKSICWRTVVKSKDVNKIGVVIYQKPVSNSCYIERKNNEPPLCTARDDHSPWYTPLDSCLLLPVVSSSGEGNGWPISWPERLNMRYPSRSDNSSTQFSQEKIDSDTKQWSGLVSEVYFSGFAIDWSSIRNVMDMNAGFGGFAASLIDRPLWVMNVVPFDQPDTLPIIFNRGLIGVYHDWCESFNTYPRTYDLLQMSYLLQSLTNRCDIIEVAAEIDRILRPGRWFVLHDTIGVIRKMDQVLRSLHYKTAIVKQQLLVARKSFWRPGSTGS